MGPFRFIKNFIGDLLGYGRCDGCGRTFWRQETKAIRYSVGYGFTFCVDCHDTKPLDELILLAYTDMVTNWRDHPTLEELKKEARKEI